MPASLRPFQYSGGGLDLSDRIARSGTVVASPALAAETIIASLTLDRDLALGLGIIVVGWAAWTVGTSGTAVTLRIRKTNVSGTVVQSSGAMTATAANLDQRTIQGFDAAATLPGQIYVLTMQVTAGAAASTVSAVELQALIV